MPRLRVLPAFEHERAKPRHAQDQRGEHPRRAEAHDDGLTVRQRLRLRDAVKRVARNGRLRTVGHFEDFILPALYGHVDGINDAHVVLFACVNGFFLQVQLLDLVRRNAQLPRSGLHESGHVAVRRQREITDADHRGDLHVWEFSLSYHRTGKNGNQKTAAPDFTKCSRKRRERQYNIHYIVSEGSALLLWQKRS